jgi:hypothetical protein
MMCYRTRADECDVCDAGVGCEMFCDIRPADDRLDDIRVVAASGECGGSYRGEVAARPGRVL